MNTAAAHLVLRLIALQSLVCFLTEATVAAFAPRLLLLDGPVIDASIPHGLSAAGALFVLQSATTLVLTHPLRPALRALVIGSQAIAPRNLLRIYALPWHLTVSAVIISFAICLATLAPSVRPATNDLPTQTELIALTITMGSVASLAGYVIMRSAVARALEHVAPSVAQQALSLLGARSFRVPRVQLRVLLAVATPVGFVALGALLLVLAQVRVFEASARESGAAELVRAALEPIDGNVAGRSDVLAAVARHGYAIELGASPAQFRAYRGEGGRSVLTVPLDDGHATVRFDATSLSPIVSVYLLLALVATALAGYLGMVIGAAYARDLALVSRQLGTLGVRDVIEGTRVKREARFVAIGELLEAIDQLGDIFSEFATAQERAIVARAAAERTRALFLASMSHDLKAPLNAVLGFAAIATRGNLRPPQRESLSIIEQRGRELLHLIETILDAARIEAGALTLAREDAHIAELLAHAVERGREVVIDHVLRVVLDVQPGLPRMQVDARRLVQALSAIIVTAGRFAAGRTVWVRAGLADRTDRLAIDVVVSEARLSGGELTRIFEAFREPERARRLGSMGLGLSVARAVVQLHGGSVEARSTPVRPETHTGGVSFAMWLPLAPPSTPSSGRRLGR